MSKNNLHGLTIRRLQLALEQMKDPVIKVEMRNELNSQIQTNIYYSLRGIIRYRKYNAK